VEFTARVNVGCRYGYVAVLRRRGEYDFMLIWGYVSDKYIYIYISSSKPFYYQKFWQSAHCSLNNNTIQWHFCSNTISDKELVFNPIHAPNPELEDTKIKIPLINVNKRILADFWAVEKWVLIIDWNKPTTPHKLTFDILGDSSILPNVIMVLYVF
jgi:hypothetical protein